MRGSPGRNPWRALGTSFSTDGASGEHEDPAAQALSLGCGKLKVPLTEAAENFNATFEDQQKVNKFARNMSRITEPKEETEVKRKQLHNLEDVCNDIMLADDDCLMIPYQIGDVFTSHSQDEAQEMLEEAKKNWQEETDALESTVVPIQRVLADLKLQLYTKFGGNINLEADEN
ncbi:prefoldin subunit 4-like [Macaca thibetana thibetana]|uniref:prefoldin subunit 4-like n=1 Tax=Macaca thibetana thibetana TaxID=257877 RepID=UPI0021BCB906|nr:prefoldin subunit 4-like [Macaca thibetana thibetana]